MKRVEKWWCVKQPGGGMLAFTVRRHADICRASFAQWHDEKWRHLAARGYSVVRILVTEEQKPTGNARREKRRGEA